MKDSRTNRAEFRRMAAKAREGWAARAYAAYVDCLLHGLPAGPGHITRQVPIPVEIHDIPVLGRHLLAPVEVAHWAFRRLVLHEKFTQIADSVASVVHDPEREGRRLTRYRTAMAGSDQEEQAYHYALRAIVTPPPRAAHSRPMAPSPDAIRKAVSRNALIWAIAHREYRG